MSLENAAAAFDADMGGKNTSTLVKEPQKAAAEPLFENLGNLEIDDDSPAQAGGDEFPVEQAEPQKKREAKPPKQREPKAEDDDFDYESFTDEELELLGRKRPGEGDEHEDDDDDNKRGEADDEDDDSTDEEKLLAQEFTVMVDGEETKVTLEKALQNYSHREALDRRMNFVEQGRAAVVQSAREVIAARQKADAVLAEAEELLTSLIPAEPNWDELFQKDPNNARALQKQYDMLKAKRDEIKGKREANNKDAGEMDVQQTINFRNAELRKFGQHAKWANAKEQAKDLDSMRRTALAVGFSEEEVAQVMDSRMLIVLRKASKYDRMMAARPKPVQTNRQQQPASPGSPRNRTAPKGNDRAMKNLRRTGSLADAASVFEGILKRSQ